MVALVAAIAPMLVAALPDRWRVPQVVVLIFSGILIGPHVLGLSDTSSVKLLADVGLGFLFLLAGYELDLRLLGAHKGRLAVIGWVISAMISLAAVAGLTYAGFVHDFDPDRAGADHHALGTLLPSWRRRVLGGRFGATSWPRVRSGSCSDPRDLAVPDQRAESWPSGRWSRSPRRRYCCPRCPG